MGVLNQRDVFTNKWVTAKIADSENMLHFVPIKYVIGNHFLAEIKKQLYCFSIKESRILTYAPTLSKIARVIDYDTDNANPVDAKQVNMLRTILQSHNLPKVNQKLYGVLKIMAQDEKEGKEFQPLLMENVVSTISEQKDKYPENARTLQLFIKELRVDQIVRPIRKVTEFLEEDMIAPDPSFIGNIASTLINLDVEHKVITNTPVKNKVAWMKIILIAMLGVLAIVGVYFLFTSGLIPHIGPTTGSAGTAGTLSSSGDLMKQYPTPEILRAAIQNGKVSCNSLPKDVKDFVNTIKPVVCP